MLSVPPRGDGLVKGFDIIGSNKALQDHWVRRILAIIIDTIIVYFPLIILFNIILIVTLNTWGWFWWGWLWPLLYGFIFFLYFIVLETFIGATIGKKLMSLRVVTTTGQPLGIGPVFVRNISKIVVLHWLDMIFGLITDGDPRQKFTDRVMNVTVTRTDAGAYAEEQFRQMQYIPPHPHVPTTAWNQPQQGQPDQQQTSQATAQQSTQATTQQPTGGWPQQSGGGWTPSQQSAPSQWPQHQWDESGQLKPQLRFCSSCGGQLSPRGDGKMTCTRCGLLY